MEKNQLHHWDVIGQPKHIWCSNLASLYNAGAMRLMLLTNSQYCYHKIHYQNSKLRNETISLDKLLNNCIICSVRPMLPHCGIPCLLSLHLYYQVEVTQIRFFDIFSPLREVWLQNYIHFTLDTSLIHGCGPFKRMGGVIIPYQQWIISNFLLLNGSKTSNCQTLFTF